MKKSATYTTKYVNRRERIGGAIYVIMFFIVGAGLCGLLLAAQSDIRQTFSRKNVVGAKMERQQNFRREQEASATECDLIVEGIRRYDPAVNAVYEKNDIQFLVNELKRRHDRNRLDKRYMVYLHLGDFYQMWFNDRQHLWSLTSNLSYIRRNLEDCEIGLEKKQNEIRGVAR
jgi:hypothetical protein